MIDYYNILNEYFQLGKNNSKRFEIICPFHNDNSFGNAFISNHNGWFSCYACDKSVHSYHLLKHVGISHKQIQNIFNWNSNFKNEFQKIIFYKLNYESKIKNSNKVSDKLLDLKNIHSIESIKDNHLINFNVNDYRYLVERGFNSEFIKYFNIKLISKGTWKDYIYIPINDNCEIRKVNEYNVFKTFNQDDTLKVMRKHFKKNKQSYLLDKSNIPFEYSYLDKPRVLYKSKSKVNENIFNIENLDYNVPLYLREGISGIPKIWNNISKNVSCTFSNKIHDFQIKVLNKFNKILLIPDLDDAGVQMVWNIRNLNNVKCLYIQSNDTDENFIKDIKKGLELEPIEWILKYYDIEIKIR